jgi:FkbM family methyltransferase
MNKAIRDAVDRWAPEFSLYYRFRRDRRSAARVPGVRLPYGFQFFSPGVAAADYETTEVQFFLANIDSAALCIDIGANAGLYSGLAASRGKRVVAIEPLAANLSLLYRNLLGNGFSNVEVYPMGLSGGPGFQRIYGAALNASFVQGWAGAPDTSYSVVPVTSLDILIGSRFDGQQVFVKLDVEGYELDVLQGAERVLSMQPKPVWLVEIVLTEQIPGGINRRFQETFELFWRHGYRAYLAHPDQRPVLPADVEHWVKTGVRTFGSYNYVFRAS